MVKYEYLNGYNTYIPHCDMVQNKRRSGTRRRAKLFAMCMAGGSGGCDMNVYENGLHKTVYIRNDKYKPYTGRMKYWFELYDYAMNYWGDTYKFSDKYSDDDFKFYMDKMHLQDADDLALNFYMFVGSNEIHNYLGIREFKNSLFITISPNWKDYTVDIIKRRDLLKRFVEDVLFKVYEDFTDYAYAIECGKQGSHIHAHVVLEVKPHKWATVNGRATKNSNYKRSICRKWNEHMEGAEGLLGSDGKYSIEIFKILEEKVMEDKLNYLIEDLKPIEHKNAIVKGFPLYKSFGD